MEINFPSKTMLTKFYQLLTNLVDIGRGQEELYYCNKSKNLHIVSSTTYLPRLVNVVLEHTLEYQCT